MAGVCFGDLVFESRGILARSRMGCDDLVVVVTQEGFGVDNDDVATMRSRSRSYINFRL